MSPALDERRRAYRRTVAERLIACVGTPNNMLFDKPVLIPGDRATLKQLIDWVESYDREDARLRKP